MKEILLNKITEKNPVWEEIEYTVTCGDKSLHQMHDVPNGNYVAGKVLSSKDVALVYNTVQQLFAEGYTLTQDYMTRGGVTQYTPKVWEEICQRIGKPNA